MSSELENNILSAIGNCDVSASGYHQLKCPMCNSDQIKAGFKFESDKIIYSCFKGKCDASSEYTYGEPLYKKFRELLNELDVDIPLSLRMDSRKPKPIEILNEELYEKHTYVHTDLPSDSRSYNPERHYWFADFLASRKVEFKHQLYISEGKLVIPFFHRGNQIGYQEVSINQNTGKTFYKTSSGNTDLMFINTKDGYISKRPIIVEGIMDAISIPDGVAILGNSVSKKQAYLLRHSTPLLIPDRKGSNFINVAKRYGWDISIPDWKVKDVNEAVIKYGKFVTCKIIHDSIQTNIKTAEVRFRAWQKK